MVTQVDDARIGTVNDPLAPDEVPATAPLLGPGARVEVRTRLDGQWAKGFEVVGVEDGAYRIRRLSDGGVLPVTFSPDDVRPQRERRRGTWWY